jgi:hypothetical protein
MRDESDIIRLPPLPPLPLLPLPLLPPPLPQLCR